MDIIKTTEDLTHIPDFSHFLKDFNQSAKCVLPPQARKYERVCVLLVRWEDDDLGTETEIIALEKVFSDLYHYETERYLIPSTDSTQELDDRLVDWRRANDNNGNNLLILYYGGHGEPVNHFNTPSRCKWVANLRPGSPSLIWSELQGNLLRCKSNVLFILDCCFAATASRGGNAKEGLWACNSEVTTTGVNDNSFTQNLIEELKRLCGTRYSVAILHQRLMARFGRPGQHRLLTEPWYTYMGSDTAPSIELIPHASSISSAMELPATETLVLVAIRLKSSDEIPDASTWQDWLQQSAPEGVDSVLALGKLQIKDLLRLEGCYTSHSGLLLLSMPICFWDRIRKTQAYKFVAFVRSSNLIQRNIRDSSTNLRLLNQNIILSHSLALRKNLLFRRITVRYMCCAFMSFAAMQYFYPSVTVWLNLITGSTLFAWIQYESRVEKAEAELTLIPRADGDVLLPDEMLQHLAEHAEAGTQVTRLLFLLSMVCLPASFLSTLYTTSTLIPQDNLEFLESRLHQVINSLVMVLALVSITLFLYITFWWTNIPPSTTLAKNERFERPRSQLRRDDISRSMGTNIPPSTRKRSFTEVVRASHQKLD